MGRFIFSRLVVDGVTCDRSTSKKSKDGVTSLSNRVRLVSLPILVCLIALGQVNAQFSQQGSKLVGTDAVGSAYQGFSVSLSSDGNTAIVGGLYDNSNAGAAWVWTRSGGIWTQQGSKLVGTGAVGPAAQGQSVSLSSDGNTAIVGGVHDSWPVGAAWVWVRSGEIWTQQGSKLVGTGGVGEPQQGYSVALSSDGNTAIVGGFADNYAAGAVWVWTRSGGVWEQQGSKLVGADAVYGVDGELQGVSVSLSSDGNTAIVGGPRDNNYIGAAWVWTRSGGIWTQQGPKLVGTGAVGAAAQGQSVSLSSDGNTAIVSGLWDNGNAGAAWVWTRSGGVWTQQGSKLVGTGAVGPAQQGYSVSLSSDGNTAMVGGLCDNSNAGAVWIWTRSSEVWTQQGSKLVGTGAVGLAQQGYSVSISSDAHTAIVGGWADNSSAGAAWIYSTPIIEATTTWRMQIKSQIASAVDNENYAGVADSASENLDSLYDIPEPPASPGDYVSLFFLHPEWGSLLGNNFAKDIKKNTPIADTVKRWYFQVKSNVVNDTVTLTFVNDGIPSALGKYLTDLKTGKRINLKSTSIYKYFNTSDTVRSFTLIIGDSTAPLLTLTSPNGSNIWRSGTSKNIVWSTSDGTGIDSIFVYSSSNGGSSYSLLQSLGYMQSTGWTIPSEYLNHNYSVKLVSRDSLGNQSSTKSAKTFTVVGDSLATSNSAGWSLISAPLTPNDSSVANMFGNTAYLWSYTQSTGYTQPSKIALGNGYWLGVTATKNWFVKGIANEADSSVQNLQLGYNIIGNNFVRNVPKNNLYFLKASSYYSFSAAVSAGLISNTMYGYSSSSYFALDTMSLFGGYWLGVLQSGVQLIEKPSASIVTPLAKQAQIFAMNWELPIKVTTVSLADNIAVIGIKPTSTNQFDALYDAPRPPRNPGGNYLELYFTNTGGNYPAILGSKYARDFRDSSSANWNFTVESSQNGNVTLGWDNTLLGGLSGTLNLKLTDMGSGQTLDMKSAPAYTFSYFAPRQFLINAKITGVGKGNDILPTDYTLSQNFPNPFNPSTTIRYGLPNRSVVKIAITNALGQQVAVLENGEREAGYHEVEWHANVSSGIYFYRIEAVSVNDPNNRFVQVKKMLLLK